MKSLEHTDKATNGLEIEKDARGGHFLHIMTKKRSSHQRSIEIPEEIVEHCKNKHILRPPLLCVNVKCRETVKAHACNYWSHCQWWLLSR